MIVVEWIVVDDGESKKTQKKTNEYLFERDHYIYLDLKP